MSRGRDTDGRLDELVAGARALAFQGLVTGFGHVSARTGLDRFVITPAKPPGSLGSRQDLIEVSLESEEMPPGVPGEVWIHWSAYRRHPDVSSVCRAQPEFAGLLAITGAAIRPVYGQGAFLGEEVPVYDSVELIRSRELGDDIAGLLGEGKALVIRGTGSVTVGSSVAESVALTWVLENNCRMQVLSNVVGEPKFLRREEVAEWSAVRSWALRRVWAYLRTATPGPA